MGGWKLEIAKMAMYMSFPVALFHYFNQPEYFEKWVIEQRRYLYPPQDPSQKEEIEECKAYFKKKNEMEFVKMLKEQENKSKNVLT